MSLRTCTFLPDYRSGEDNLIEDFYHPALAQSREYWRAVGYFSSSALEAIGQPLGHFVIAGGSIRLITSVELTPEDIQAIQNGLDRKSICERRLLEQIAEDFSEPVGRGAALLTALLEVGRLDIKIAMPTQQKGIYHEKVGLFIGSDDEYVAFAGSSNESQRGLTINYECVDVFTSWSDPERAGRKRRHFERLWNGTADGVVTFDFPDAVKNELLRLTRNTAPQVGDNVNDNRWEHQDRAIQLFLEHKCGVLEMATGTGKTRTALRICKQLFESRKVQTIIIATDGNDLLDQWRREVLELTRSQAEKLAIFRTYGSWHERDQFLLSPERSILLTSRQTLPQTLARLPARIASKTILIHDEVHGLGSPGNREALKGLADSIPYRLGLSATPDREYDADGSAFILEHIGPVLMTFGIEDAIRQGILAPFNYYPLEYTPDPSDRARLQQIHRRFEARKNTADPMSPEELWIELANVYKGSKAKLPVFEAFISEHVDLLKRCIIFVHTREFGDEVVPIVHEHRHDFHVYYAEDDSEILRRFAEGSIECVLTCHRLSEGIDIRSLETVILFASSRTRLETIQRIGRCLRRNPSDPSKTANVVDFIRVDDEGPNDNSDQQRRDWLTRVSQTHLERIVTDGS